eukprot:766222-Hanusia_phi.AAC.4
MTYSCFLPQCMPQRNQSSSMFNEQSKARGGKATNRVSEVGPFQASGMNREDMPTFEGCHCPIVDSLTRDVLENLPLRTFRSEEDKESDRKPKNLREWAKKYDPTLQPSS